MEYCTVRQDRWTRMICLAMVPIVYSCLSLFFFFFVLFCGCHVLFLFSWYVSCLHICVLATGSAEFVEFLGVLGQTITLKGWSKYRGGLDVRSIYLPIHFCCSFSLICSSRLILDNTTGETSVYTEFHNIEIMFHVSTMLPHQVDDTQKVAVCLPMSTCTTQIGFRLKEKGI